MIKYWLWLSQVPYIGPKGANHLLKIFGNPKSVYNADINELSKIGGISSRQIESIKVNHTLDASKRIMEKCEQNNINILTLSDKTYPNKVRFSDSPLVLYYKGNIEQLSNTIGIVGPRRCSREERRTAIDIAASYARKGITIISGMAKGIDSYAHTSCIKAEGFTIAILANGLDICYPKEHDILMRSIQEHGMLLSEYPPGTRPTPYSFPCRNRLISAWSDELIVIGAGRGSGALITAEYSEKYGRSVQYISADL